MKYRKKPVVIEAFQMTAERREDNADWPEWLNAAWQMHPDDDGALFPETVHTGRASDRLAVRTLEGVHAVSYGDWIIQGVKGELYPCKPDIFAMTYEETEE